VAFDDLSDLEFIVGINSFGIFCGFSPVGIVHTHFSTDNDGGFMDFLGKRDRVKAGGVAKETGSQCDKDSKGNFQAGVNSLPQGIPMNEDLHKNLHFFQYLHRAPLASLDWALSTL
jgi:hypothetical protein